MAEKIRFTTRRIVALTCPEGRRHIDLFDADQAGLALRVTGTGTRTFYAVYRVGAGRAGKVRWQKIGRHPEIGPAEARRRAREILGQVVRGVDPASEERKARVGRLGAAIDAYAADCERRRLVAAKVRVNLLRRELLGRFGDVPLDSLDRRSLTMAVAELEAKGLKGKAQEFRTRTAVFLNWCVDQGLLQASPLAGWRRPRRSRAERLERPGRALEDGEIPLLWRAFEASPDPIFTAYLRILLLLGQRRTETALMRWRDVNLNAGLWTIPAEVTKAGREHKVPLPREVIAILATLPRLAGSELVFPGRGGAPMTGWSKRMRPVRAASRELGLEPWTLHDLRRTVRTGLARLGVRDEIAERALNHSVRDVLAAVYDRSDRLEEMREALTLWAGHVLGLAHGGNRALRAAGD